MAATAAAAGLIAPHGGTLINRNAPADQRAALQAKAQGLKNLTLTPREVSDLRLIAVGAFSPIEGFMTRRDYESVVSSMRLDSGHIWSIPITLSITVDEAKEIKEGDDVYLTDAANSIKAILHVQEIFPYDKSREAQEVYRTTEEAHPGVEAMYQQDELLVGGPVTVLEASGSNEFTGFDLNPSATRAAFAEKGWRTVVGFQTRNPVHRAHEYIQKSAMEIVDGLLLHPLVGETKAGDIPADVRMACYKALLEGYYPQNRVVLSVLPAAMRYAGPREAVFHAMVRKNYGCTHFIVGRDHAGVGTYYGTYDAQDLLRQFPAADLGITPLYFDNSFFCRSCGNMATEKTCPHAPDARVSLSGTAVREMLTKGEVPPMEFTRPEVAEILIKASQ